MGQADVLFGMWLLEGLILVRMLMCCPVGRLADLSEVATRETPKTAKTTENAGALCRPRIRSCGVNPSPPCTTNLMSRRAEKLPGWYFREGERENHVMCCVQARIEHLADKYPIE